jgi:hypothetical protein
MKRVLGRALLAIAAGGLVGAAADFTYTDKTEVTGGTMKSTMEMAARFSKGAAAANATTVHRVKGDKMASQSDKTGSIIDLAAETLTAIDYDKKEYSTITFTEMAAAMKQMMGKMDPKARQGDPQMKFNVTAENTGKTKLVQGIEARQHIVKVTMESTDAKSGNKGATETTMDLWLGKVPGSEAIREFGRKAAAKMAFDGGAMGPMAGMLGAGGMQGMAEARKKMGEMDGLALYSVTRLGGTGMPTGADPGQAPPPQAQPQQQPSGESVGGALGRFGGLGRLGRKKQEPPQQQAPNPHSAPAAQGSADGSAVMLETTTEIISWSPAPIDDALMSVPAGFKQVEHPMKKQLR